MMQLQLRVPEKVGDPGQQEVPAYDVADDRPHGASEVEHQQVPQIFDLGSSNRHFGHTPCGPRGAT